MALSISNVSCHVLMCVGVWTEKIDGTSDKKAENAMDAKKPRKKECEEKKAKEKENR